MLEICGFDVLHLTSNVTFIELLGWDNHTWEKIEFLPEGSLKGSILWSAALRLLMYSLGILEGLLYEKYEMYASSEQKVMVKVRVKQESQECWTDKALKRSHSCLQSKSVMKAMLSKCGGIFFSKGHYLFNEQYGHFIQIKIMDLKFSIYLRCKYGFQIHVSFKRFQMETNTRERFKSAQKKKGK